MECSVVEMGVASGVVIVHVLRVVVVVETVTKPSGFAHFGQGAHSLAPAT